MTVCPPVVQRCHTDQEVSQPGFLPLCVFNMHEEPVSPQVEMEKRFLLLHKREV